MSDSSLQSWLKDNKLEDLYESIKAKEVTLDELKDFETNELKEFCKTILNADTISTNRFLKAVTKLKDCDSKNEEKKVDRGSLEEQRAIMFFQSHHVVSKEETTGLRKLQDRFGMVLQLQAQIERSFMLLNRCRDTTCMDINTMFDNLGRQMSLKESQSTSEMGHLHSIKKHQLERQLRFTQDYLFVVDEGRKRYEKLINDPNFGTGSLRKQRVMTLVKDVLEYPGIIMCASTQPKLCFSPYGSSLDLFLKSLSINDCDQPSPPTLTVKKVQWASVSIEWKVSQLQVEHGKEILDFQVEWCPLPKNYKQHSGRGSSSEESSESEKESESSDSSDEESKDDKKKTTGYYDDEVYVNLNNGDDVEICNEDSMPWRSLNNGAVKASKRKYTVNKLLQNSPYAFRIRARNSSGYGEWSSTIFAQTKKVKVKSHILGSSELKKLFKWVPKSSKRKWKLVFNTKKNGSLSSTFHSKCDGKAPTVTIVESTRGTKFGGYTECPWANSGSYKFDKKAFIYTIKNNKNQPPQKWNVIQQKSAVYHHSNYGPTFGNGFDFYLANNCTTNTTSYTQLGTGYGAPKDNNLLAGGYNFQVKNYEVFHLIKSKSK